MPLLNRIGGGASSAYKAPVTGRATFISTTELRIENNLLHDFVHLVLYATHYEGVSDNKTVFFFMTNVKRDSILVRHNKNVPDMMVLMQSTFAALYYGSVSMLHGNDIFSVTHDSDNNYTTITINSDYVDLYNFNPEVFYIYTLFG